VSGVFQNIDPHPQRRGGTHSPGGEEGGRSIFWKTPDIWIGLLQLIPSTVHTYGRIVKFQSAGEEGDHQVLCQHPHKPEQAHVQAKLGRKTFNDDIKCRLCSIF